jgi:hypothetical protein
VCTVDACNGSGSCVFGSNLNCDDNNTCTQDSCDPDDGCQISGTPSNSCLAANKAIFLVKNSSTNGKDKVKFLWKGGPALIQDLGDPTQTTRYELCVYDANGIQMAMGVPPGAPWQTVGAPASPSGYKYKDAGATNDGIKIMKLKASNLNKAQMKVLGKGDNLPDTETLPFQFPVTAQLYASDGACWEAQFTQAETRKNSISGYTGKSPAP